MKSKFLDLYNLVMESLSDEAETLLTKETNTFIDNLKNDKKCDDFKNILSDTDNSDEIKHKIKKTIRHGSIKSLYKSIDTILTNKKFNNECKNVFLNLIDEFYDDFKILENIYDKENNDKENNNVKLIELTDIPNVENGGLQIVNEAHDRFGFSDDFIKVLLTLKKTKNSVGMGDGEILCSLLFKDGQLASEKGDVYIETFPCEIKSNNGKLLEPSPDPGNLRRAANKFLKDSFERNKDSLTNKVFNVELESASALNFSSSNWNKTYSEIFKKQFKKQNIKDNNLAKEIIINLIKIVFNESDFKEIGKKFNEFISNNKDAIIDNDCNIDLSLFRTNLLKCFIENYKKSGNFKYILFLNKKTFRLYSFDVDDIDNAIKQMIILDNQKYNHFSWPTFGSKEGDQQPPTTIKFSGSSS